MAVLVEVTRRVPGVVVVLAGNLADGLILVAVLVEVTRRVPGVVMVLAGNLTDGLVPVAMLVKVARRVPGMVVVLTGLFLWHVSFLLTRCDNQPARFRSARHV